MGAVAGICAPIACCFTQNACKLCCSSLPNTKYSTATRIGYSVLLAVTTIISYICKTDALKNLLIKIKPLLSYYNSTVVYDYVGYEAVYRIQFSLAIFFFVMSLVMINVRTSRDIRAYFHNGFWFFKILGLIVIVILIFQIHKTDSFSGSLYVIGIIASFVFILIQLILIIDFAHSWNESWVERGEEDRSWYGGLLSCSIIMTGLAFSCVICMYVYLTYSPTTNCGVQKTIITIHLLTSIILYILSLHPKIQEVHSASGLLQASCIFLYTTYLVLLALGLEGGPCNRMLNSANSSAFQQFSGIISLIFTTIMLIYSCYRNSEKGHLLGIGAHESPVPSSSPGNVDQQYGQQAYDDEEDGVAYNYSMFHCFMCFAALYLMLTITNWHKYLQLLSSPVQVVDNSSPAAMWVKIVSSWCCQLIYGWTLVAPIVLRDRDFY